MVAMRADAQLVARKMLFEVDRNDRAATSPTSATARRPVPPGRHLQDGRASMQQTTRQDTGRYAERSGCQRLRRELRDVA
jgi:hypothetical protein